MSFSYQEYNDYSIGTIVRLTHKLFSKSFKYMCKSKDS